ncbi:MAG: Ldh family oxidoreductase [Thermoprotei archaeon]
MSTPLQDYEKEPSIPPTEYIRVDPESLLEYVTKVFETLGTKREYAEIVADVLVKADLMGISSHGVQRIRRYVDGIRCGNIKPNNEPVVVSDVGAITVLDARMGFGQVAGVKAIEIAIEKAQYYGVGVVAVRNSNHYGIAGYYALRAVEKGYIGISMTNSRALVAYTHTLEKNIGTNPIAIGIPRKNPPPILFDAATSVVPVGKIELYSRIGKTVPEGWVVDLENGEIVSGDASKILDMIKEGRAALLPLGGLGELLGGHKGSALSLIIDIFSGVLSGAGWGRRVGYTVGDKPSNVGHFFIVLDIDAFMDREVFWNRLEEYIKEIKSSKKHPTSDHIWIPGEKSWYTMQTRLRKGVPLHKNVYNDLVKLGKELGVQVVLRVKS